MKISRILFLSSASFFLLLVLWWWVDYDAQWKIYQRGYYLAAIEKEREGEGAEGPGFLGRVLDRLRVERMLGIEQTFLPGGQVERCVTCHLGYGDLDVDHPFLPSSSPFEGKGCMICHRGDGRATTVEGAHHGMLLAAGRGVGAHSIRGMIERLESLERFERAEAAETLRSLTGLDMGYRFYDPPEDRKIAIERWWMWLEARRATFEPDEEPPDPSAHIDYGAFDSTGQRRAYVGSTRCVRCHWGKERRHVERWMETKGRSMERVKAASDFQAGTEIYRRSCYPCHTTGFDAETGRYVEEGVGCEGCHGPGERYDAIKCSAEDLLAEGRETEGKEMAALGAKLARFNVEGRRLVQGDFLVNICVTCHNPRNHDMRLLRPPVR